MGLFYNAIGADNHVHGHRVQTCGDFFYALFAGEYRDGVNEAHRVVTQIVRPVFAQIEQESVDFTDSLASNLRKLVERRKEACGHASEAIQAYALNPFDFQWERWSDFLHLSFWGNLIAYAVHFAAMKFWDVLGADHKKDEITRAYGHMVGQHARGLVVGKNKDGENPLFTLSANLKSHPVSHQLSPVLQFRLFVNALPMVSFTAERAWEAQGKKHCPEAECWEGRFDFSSLPRPHLLVSFASGVQDHHFLSFQMGAAIELLLLSGMDSLAMKTPKGFDFSKFFFVKESETADSIFWTIEKDVIESDDGGPLPGKFNKCKNLKAVVEQYSALTEIPRTVDLFPVEYIFPLDEQA
jgi:hypothetical protein